MSSLFNAVPKNDFEETPKNFSHAVYLILEETPNLRQGEIRNILKERGWNPGNLGQAVRDLFKGGYISYKNIKGSMQDPDDRMKFRWQVTNKQYTPKVYMKKIEQPAVEATPVIQEHVREERKHTPLTLVQGIATLDADDPNFGAAAKEIIEKVGGNKSEEVTGSAEEEQTLITGIWVDIGKQSVVMTPAQFKKLFKEMKAMLEG